MCGNRDASPRQEVCLFYEWLIRKKTRAANRSDLPLASSCEPIPIRHVIRQSAVAFGHTCTARIEPQVRG